MEKSLIFIDNLEKAAASGKEFRMDDLCTGLTFDIIGGLSRHLNSPGSTVN